MFSRHEQEAIRRVIAERDELRARLDELERRLNELTAPKKKAKAVA